MAFSTRLSQSLENTFFFDSKVVTSSEEALALTIFHERSINYSRQTHIISLFSERRFEFEATVKRPLKSSINNSTSERCGTALKISEKGQLGLEI